MFFFYAQGLDPNPPNRVLTDDQLRDAISFLNARDIWIGVEEGAVKEWGGDGNLEATITKRNIDRIKRLGGEVRYIKMDEPIVSGMAVLGLSLEATVDATVNYVKQIKAHDSRIIVGDIESYPGTPASTLLNWIVRFKEKGGQELPFFILDINYSHIRYLKKDTVWTGEVLALKRACEARGIRFGIIFWCSNYFKEESEMNSDFDFYASTMGFAENYISAFGVPDIVDVQSWSYLPKYNLPDYAGFSFMQLVRDFGDRFIAPLVRVYPRNR